MTKLLAALMILAATAGTASAERDPWGNTYPEQCPPAALDEISLPIIEVNKLPYAPGHTSDAHWLERPGGNVILVRKGLSAVKHSAAIRHEKTHECMFRLTGSPEWH